MPAPTSDDIDAVWAEKVWRHPTMLAATPNVFPYDVSEEGNFNLAKLLHDAEVNFFLCLVQRRADPNEVGGGTQYQFTVRVEYYLQQTDVPDETYRLHRRRLEAVDDLARTQLGKLWGGTVTYWTAGVPIPTTRVVIDGVECWRGGYTYTAFKKS